MGKAAGNAALDRDIRRAVALTLWVVANGRSAPARTMREAPDAADKAAVDLIELYETANDAVLVDLYDEWRAEARSKDTSAERFGKLLAGAAIGNKSDVDHLIDAGAPRRIPEFEIELKNGVLMWTGESIEDDKPFEPAKWNPEIPSEADYLGETLGAPTLNPDKLSCPCGGTMVPKGTETIAGQKRYVAECPQCGDARYSLKPYRPRGLGKPPWLSPNPRGRLAPGVAAHERRARKVGSLACPCGAQMVDTGETRKIKGDVKRYIAECPNCGDARYSMAPYPKE